MTPTLWHSAKGKTRKRVRKSVILELGGQGEEGIDREQRSFGAVKIFCRLVWWWIKVILHLSKPIECFNTKSEPFCNLWTSNDYDVSRRFILERSILFSWGILIIGEDMYVWGHEIYRGFLYFSFCFLVNLTLL